MPERFKVVCIPCNCYTSALRDTGTAVTVAGLMRKCVVSSAAAAMPVITSIYELLGQVLVRTIVGGRVVENVCYNVCRV